MAVPSPLPPEARPGVARAGARGSFEFEMEKGKSLREIFDFMPQMAIFASLAEGHKVIRQIWKSFPT